MKLKYAAKDFINASEQPPYIQTIFQTPEDVIQAYYAILQDALFDNYIECVINVYSLYILLNYKLLKILPSAAIVYYVRNKYGIMR